MATLVLGVAGAFIGGPLLGFGMIGSSLGFLAGNLIGNLLDPPRSQGPRLTDLKVLTSSYGNPIPIMYGTARIPGAGVIWKTDLVEHQHHEGGKGGPSVTTFTYTLSFAVGLCEGPIQGVTRIWADGKLIVDKTPGSLGTGNDVNYTLYLGTESQLPDPTMEADKGVGNVPAHRGMAYIVFPDYEANRIPQLSFEIITASGVYPWVVSLFTRPYVGSEAGFAFPDDHTINVGHVSTGGSTGVPYTLEQYDWSGNLTATTISNTLAAPRPDFGTNCQGFVCKNNPRICFVRQPDPVDTTNPDSTAWYVDGMKVASPVRNAGFDAGGTYYAVFGNGQIVFANDAVYVIGGNTAPWVARYDAPGGIPSTVASAAATLTAPHPADGFNTGASWNISAGDDGNIYVVNDDGANGTYAGWIFKYDKDLNLVHTWSRADQLAVNSQCVNTGGTVAAVDNKLYFQSHATGIGTGVVDSVSGTTLGAGGTNTAWNAYTHTFDDVISMGNGLVLAGFGIVSINPPPAGTTLSAIVTNLCTRAGLAAYDVSELTDVVDGYVLERQMPVRAAIEPLQRGFYFDGVESDDVVKFPKRGRDSVVTIPDADLGAYEYGSTPPPIVELTRASDPRALPAVLTVKYTNKDADYQDGAESERRQVGGALAQVTAEVPVVMDRTKARQIAGVLMFQDWIERDRYATATPRKYAYLEPTDVVTIQGVPMALREKQEGAAVIKWQAVRAQRNVYLAGPYGAPQIGFTSIVSPTPQPTQLVLLDMPTVTDADDPFSIYAAIAGANSADWLGALLYKSADGSAYSQIATDPDAAVLGIAISAPGNFTSGNIVDELNTFDVLIGQGGGALSSVAYADLLNGSNTAVVGSEILQYRTATLVSPSRYTLSGLLRGRRGTEWAIGSHTPGETFVALPVQLVPAPLSELNQLRYYKAPMAGTTLGAAVAQTFTNSGNTLQPYAPVQLGGGVDASGNATLQWVRRTRLGGAWINGADAQLGETVEKYVVQIWNATYDQCARQIIVTAATTASYTAAQQVTDFGAAQQTIYFSVAQIGDYRTGVQANGSLAGTGGSSVNPLAPIAPYGGTTPSAGFCTLPTTRTDMALTGTGVTTRYLNLPWAAGEVWLLTFTTPNAPAIGRITIAEFTGAPCIRRATLSASPCGVPFGPGCYQVGFTASFNFFVQSGNTDPTLYPTLLPNTTYYLWATTDVTSGAFCDYKP